MSGRIALTCGLRAGRSALTRVRYDGLARVSRTLRDGDAAHVVVALLGPGILGGDAYATDAAVEAGASLVVSGQMATPVYARSAPSATRMAWQVAAGAALVVRSEPLMLDAGAQHDADTTLDVAAHGFAILADLVTVADGALARVRTTARIDGRLVARDACDLRARAGAVATLLVVCDDSPRQAALAHALGAVTASATGVRAGIGATPGAVLVRATSPHVWPLRCLLEACVAAAALAACKTSQLKET